MRQLSTPKSSHEKRERIERIASNQRMVILVLLAYLGVILLGIATDRPGPDAASLEVVFGVAVLCVVIAGFVFAVRMAQALEGPGSGILYAILLLIPLLSLITILVLNSQATGELRRAGLKVGLLGVSSGQLDAWRMRQ